MVIYLGQLNIQSLEYCKLYSVNISVHKYTSRAILEQHSSNAIIYKLIRESGEGTREMVEKLMNGRSITVPIYEDTVYADIDVNSEHIWSFLLFTGYLKHIKTELRDNLIYLRQHRTIDKKRKSDIIGVWKDK